MCSVSASPVMKITGTFDRPASRFSLRQVSKPSMPGMTASSRMMSGVIWSTMRIAAAPSSATITVIPAPSSASVSNRSVSGESSTTRATSRFLLSVFIRVQGLECCHVLIEVEPVDQRPHLRDEVGMFRMGNAEFVELELNGPDVADPAETHQLFDVFQWRSCPCVRPPMRLRHRVVALIAPFELQQLTYRLQQPRNVDRLHQIAVMERLRQRPSMGFER